MDGELETLVPPSIRIRMGVSAPEKMMYGKMACRTRLTLPGVLCLIRTSPASSTLLNCSTILDGLKVISWLLRSAPLMSAFLACPSHCTQVKCWGLRCGRHGYGKCYRTTPQLIDELCAKIKHILRCIAVGAETCIDAWCMSEDDSGGRTFHSCCE